MSNADIARELLDLAGSNWNRGWSLAQELGFWTTPWVGRWSPRSAARREELRSRLERLPRELSRAAAGVLKRDRAHTRHLNALRRAERDDNIEILYRELKRIAHALIADSAAGQRIETLVTLNQVAPLANRQKRTLERYLNRGKLPAPDFRGGNGKASKWRWSTLRPALEKVCDRRLPEHFPAAQIIQPPTTADICRSSPRRRTHVRYLRPPAVRT